MNRKETNMKEAEKLSEILATAEASPAIQAILAQRAVEVLATRREAAGKIEALKKERDKSIPKLLADRDGKEEIFKRAKVALKAAAMG